VQKDTDIIGFTEITPVADIAAARHGERAKCLQRLIRLDLPVPRAVALGFSEVARLAQGARLDMRPLLDLFGPAPLVSVRPSSQDPEWGGPAAVLNVGMNAARHACLAQTHGQAVADAFYLGFVQAYATHVAGLDPGFAEPGAGLAEMLAAYEEETEAPFPQDPAVQLSETLRAMARDWTRTSARLLRSARGAPEDAGLGLVVQDMALGLGEGESGAGEVQFADSETGQRRISGRYRVQARAGFAGEAALEIGPESAFATRFPEVFATLRRAGETCRLNLREEMRIEFIIADGKLAILDALRIGRSARAAVRIAVMLADEGIISRETALARIEPRALSELLHSQVDRTHPRDVIARGIAASPGAATGRLVFGSAAAQASAARGEPCILVRRETTPEDIRGMHAAAAVLTERGGMTSHAAVIARGLGLPCIVGISDMRLNTRDGALILADGRVLHEGDTLTVDGTTGEAIAGEVRMLEAALDDAFQALMGWAEAACDIGIRANADTPDDARTARRFGAEGIGLCRTEHMFFESDRLTVMREMIFARGAVERAQVLERLLPMQRNDFTKLFEIMQGLPVCIRLFDPPLHEFLPTSREGEREMAEALGKPLSEIVRRVQALSEFNPMLGMRGVRLGIAVPEIYDMQARAIFEAAVDAAHAGAPVVPEIMIPLVSAMREVELVRARVDALADIVRAERGVDFAYRLGVMVETPRAALRAGDIARQAAFLSFGTNDLTQMTYGLSRDDAGRFMGSYVQQGVFPEDPFHTLDVEGVGELLKIGAERGRAARPDITLSICGEHGGNADSIAFCRNAGFDYVSCSPFRVPVARLAAAQLALARRR